MSFLRGEEDLHATLHDNVSIDTIVIIATFKKLKRKKEKFVILHYKKLRYEEDSFMFIYPVDDIQR